MSRPLLLFAVHAASFWSIGCWYVARLTDGSDEPWGIAAFATAIVLTWPRHRRSSQSSSTLLLIGAVLTLIYAVITPFTLPLIRAVFAMAALACTWVYVAGARAKLPAVALLFALSLPVMASLQFFAGYPLRVITAAGSDVLLSLCGLNVERETTSLLWNSKTVIIDAPCSGIRMLWTGATLCGALGLLRDRVSWRALMVLLLSALPVLLCANALRGAALFLLEIRDTAPSSLLHDVVGIGTFVLACGGIVAMDALLQRRPESVKAFSHRRLAAKCS
jgi:exosortase